MKVMLATRLFTPAMLSTDKKDYREALRHIWIEYDEDKQVLTTVGTNAQLMVISKAIITDEETKEFCKVVFSEKFKGYMLPESVLKSKSPVVIFELEGDRLLCDGGTVGIFDGSMPHWEAVLPKSDWTEAQYYCAFDPDLVKKLDKALGNKRGSIIDKRPFVSAIDNKSASDEAICPHIWNTADEQGFNQLALLMPRRLS